VDAELMALASTAGNTLVTLLATDAWEKARSAVGRWWRRVHPASAGDIEAELAEARAALIGHVGRDEQSRQGLADALQAEWAARLRRLLAAHPHAADELRRLLDEELTPALPTASQSWSGQVGMRAKASGRGRVYQVGQGTMNLGER
jgi:hypothetical protein